VAKGRTAKAFALAGVVKAIARGGGATRAKSSQEYAGDGVRAIERLNPRVGQSRPKAGDTRLVPLARCARPISTTRCGN
jgi:hypothetical protein